jgi:hypothetical protein
MGWERRRTAGPYYTRSRRLNGRIEREYIGKGPVANLVAGWDAEDRAARAAEHKAEREYRRDLERLDELVETNDHLAECLARVALVATGHYRHHGGEWRRRRG